MRVPTRCAASHVQARKRSRTLRVMRETPSSTRIDADHVMEPPEKTSPPLGVEKCTISAPPSSTLVPLARSRVPGGELGVRLSVSCPDAPPGTRSCRLALPNTSPAHKPVPSNAQWLASTTRYGAAVIAPVGVYITPSSAAVGSNERCMRFSYGGSSSCVRNTSVASSTNDTSQSSPLPPRYTSRPPRSNTHCRTRVYISRDQYSGCVWINNVR